MCRLIREKLESSQLVLRVMRIIMKLQLLTQATHIILKQEFQIPIVDVNIPANQIGILVKAMLCQMMPGLII